MRLKFQEEKSVDEQHTAEQLEYNECVPDYDTDDAPEIEELVVKNQRLLIQKKEIKKPLKQS